MITAVNFDLQRWGWPAKEFQVGKHHAFCFDNRIHSNTRNTAHKSKGLPDWCKQETMIAVKGYQNMLFSLSGYLPIFR